MSDLPVLKPLPVSWMVSPSVPHLKVAAAETDSKSPTTVEFFATHQDGTMSRMRLVFRRGNWMKWSPNYTDAEVVPEADYDWSEVPLLSTGADYEKSRRERRDKWAMTGLCPDPQVYEVHNSPWLKALPWPSSGGEDYRHYLILGHDNYVEVLATDWHDEELSERKM
jgi:hypothetical protein